MRQAVSWALLLLILNSGTFLHAQSPKPKLTIDEFFNSVHFSAVRLSPDGTSVVIETERADWEQQVFRKDLWLFRTASNALTQLTQSGQDSSPMWSPDGQWIAFLSERPGFKAKEGDSDDAKRSGLKEKARGDVAQLYLISTNGGESFAVTAGDEEVHAFAWSSDSKSIYFATRQAWTKTQKDDHKYDWKDVIRYRGDERGDAIYRVSIEQAMRSHLAVGVKQEKNAEKDSDKTSDAVEIVRSPLRIDQMCISPDGKHLAFVTSSISERQEKIDEIELFLVDLATKASSSAPIRLTHNEAVELNLTWAPDNRHLFFQVNLGSAEGKYEDPQPRLYWVDTSAVASNEGNNASEKALQRWFADYPGEVVNYTSLPDGSVLCACRMGTEVQFASQADPKAAIIKIDGWPGTYAHPSATRHLMPVAFVYSSTTRPNEVYLASSIDKLAQARPVTSFNRLFTTRDLPQAKPFRWVSDDGTSVEGMLMYPPGKFEAKNLPTFVFIHGGPQDADGNHFEADWYQWDRLAATAGWLVFEPNYRGSTGYGDKFALQIVPEIVSRPGKDILSGVDALVNDGIADKNQLTVGGYSYGGYMTNWLITQTTRFKAAVTGAGAVEHVANWGNDDTTFDDAYFLGGLPWQAPDRYRSEAAIYQIDKVRTPTHMVAGADDIRVAVAEDYLLDRALHELNIPSDLLIFPGEGHSLAKNPWHGKIKVREELKWLEKYGGATTK